MAKGLYRNCYHSRSDEFIAHHIALLENLTYMIACVICAVKLLYSIVEIRIEFCAESIDLDNVHLIEELLDLSEYHAHAVFEVLVAALEFK